MSNNIGYDRYLDSQIDAYTDPEPGVDESVCGVCGGVYSDDDIARVDDVAANNFSGVDYDLFVEHVLSEGGKLKGNICDNCVKEYHRLSRQKLHIEADTYKPKDNL